MDSIFMNCDWQPPQPLTREFRFVSACSWIPRDAAPQARQVADLAPASLDWGEVAALVGRHGLTGVFTLAMARLGWDGVPDVMKERFKGQRLQQAARALSQVAELSRIGDLFARHGVDLIPLKGVVLSQELYGDPTIRNSGDIDILVRSEDVAVAGELLRGLGYCHGLGFQELGARQQQHIIKSLHHHEYVHGSTGTHLELHWRSFLWTEGQVAPLWENSSPVSGGSASMRQLAKEDMILFLADHGARHGWLSLKWLSDMAMLLENRPASEWQALYDRAACFDLQRVLLQTALLLKWFYGIVPPEGIMTLIGTDRMAVRLAGYGASQLLASKSELALQVKRFAGPRDALMIKMLKRKTPLYDLVRNVLIKPEDFLEFPLPDSLFWLYIPLRPWFWFRRHYLAGARK